MAKNSVNTDTAQSVEKKKSAESRYPASELAREAEKIFGAGVTQDIVTAAFFVAGKNEATKSEAKEIVNSFLTKGGSK